MKALLSFCLLISFIGSAQKLDRKHMYKYSDDVEFRVYSVQKSRVSDQGNYTYIAEKGMRFFTIVFDFKNNSSEEQLIDFENIFIKDANDELHKVDFVVMAMKLTTGTKKFQQKLKANKKRKIITGFVPPMPKDEIIRTLVVNGEEIELVYK